MNRINIHLETEKFEMKLSDPTTEFSETEYRILELDKQTTLFGNDVQLEQMFDALDKGLHEETYLQLQDRAFGLEVDLDTANDLIERLESNLQDLM